MSERDWTFWLGVLGAVVVLGVGAFAVWYDYQHPCIRRGPYRECANLTCTNYDTKTGACLAWMTTSYDCSECLERAASRKDTKR